MLQRSVKALDTFDNGKTPGNDGNSVGVFMTEVFNHSFELGQMSNSQKQAVVTLIDKKGKDRMFLENWRPISLINVDSKIATKVIANRIKNVLPGIIHSNQSGFMKGRFLLLIDFEKAFDSIELNVIFFIKH